MSSATEAAATLVSAPFNPAAGPVAARNRTLCHKFLEGNLQLDEKKAFLVKAAKDNLGNGLGFLSEDEMAQFLEKFPYFHPDSTEKHDYFAVAENVYTWLEENNLLPNARILLKIGFDLAAAKVTVEE
jgi:hypothetical protein